MASSQVGRARRFGAGLRRHRGLRLGLASTLVCAVAGVAAVSSAGSAAASSPTDGFFLVQDVNGANDVPAQSDLSQMGRNDGDSTTYKLFWSWDSTDQWAGSGQTGDACALFDYNGNTKIDAVVCGQVSNPNADISRVQLTHAPFVFRCDDSRNDRCGQPSAQQPYTATDIAAGRLSAPVATANNGAFDTSNLITATDPFNAAAPNGPGSNYSNDASLQVNIKKTFLNGTAAGQLASRVGPKYPALTGPAVLVNVCSYPSAGNGGNNNPFDCIASPGSGFLVIVKNSGSTAGTWNFSYGPSAALAVGQSSSTSLTTAVPAGGTVATASTATGIPLLVGTDRTVGETQISGWNLASATCVVNGSSTGSRASGATSFTGVTIASGATTTCTFNNARNTGSIIVKKVKDDNTTALAGAGFTATPGQGSAASSTFSEGATGVFCLDGLIVGDNYAITESTVPTNYNGDANAVSASGISVPVAVTGTCAARLASTWTEDLKVKNTRKLGSIVIKKVDGNGNALAGAAFSITKVSGDDSVTTAQSVPAVGGSTGLFCLGNLPTNGVYSVSEDTTPAGYDSVSNIPNVTVSSTPNDCTTAATRTGASLVTVTNTKTPGTINVHKQDDVTNNLPGVEFKLYADVAPLGSYSSTVEGAALDTQSTDQTGDAQFQNVTPGNYCVVETPPTSTYSSALPQCIEVGTGTTADNGDTQNLTFTNSRKHKVIVLVCHEGTNTLDASSVTVGSGTGSTKTSLAAAGLPSTVSETDLCGLGGATYGGLEHTSVTASVTPN